MGGVQHLNVIIDAKNLSYRMFSTLDLYNSEGENVAALFGVIKNVHSLVEKFQPERVIVCWDTATSALWRRKIYPDYKMNRRKNSGQEDEEEAAKREDFERQNDLLQLALAWLPVYQIVVDELEADDIMYLLTQKVLKGQDNIVVSTDKDLLQLIDEKTSIWSPIKEVMITHLSNLHMSEEFGVKTNTFKAYMGFEIDKFIDFKVLQGDKSDGIAGIQGIGEKTAIQLLEKYSSINGMFENAEELSKSKRTVKIIENEELIQDLTSIMDIAKVEIHVEDALKKCLKGIIQPDEDYKKFWNFARDNDFKSIYMDYRIWCRPFEQMGIKPFVTKRKKRKPKSKL
jgi:DNA polymerase-1